MPYENRAEIIGHIGKEVEIRTMQSGDKVANFSVATSEKWKDKATGEPKEATEWHRIVVFKQPTVKFLEQYAGKGTTVRVIGKLQTRKWTDNQTGQDKYTTEIVVNGMEHKVDVFSKNDNAKADPQAPYKATWTGPSDESMAFSGIAPDREHDDEIPF